MGIDVSLGALQFEENVVGRATTISSGPGLDIRTRSVEDLLVLKLFASHPVMPKEWSSGTKDQLLPLVEIKEAPEILHTLARLRRL